MGIIERLRVLQKERGEAPPFKSLLEFEKWADEVRPLLDFNEGYAHSFSQAAMKAGVSARSGSKSGAGINMNKAVGILNRAVSTLELEDSTEMTNDLGFEALLHPIIRESSLTLYKGGHLRDAVLNSVTAVFDLIREKSGIAEDGDRLIGQAFSINDPVLVLSELESESGQNDQKGFMQIYKGAYQGIRNPKAHTLIHDLDEMKAAQYLVFSSMLARRIDEAKNA